MQNYHLSMLLNAVHQVVRWCFQYVGLAGIYHSLPVGEDPF